MCWPTGLHTVRAAVLLRFRGAEIACRVLGRARIFLAGAELWGWTFVWTLWNCRHSVQGFLSLTLHTCYVYHYF